MIQVELRWAANYCVQTNLRNVHVKITSMIISKNRTADESDKPATRNVCKKTISMAIVCLRTPMLGRYRTVYNGIQSA